MPNDVPSAMELSTASKWNQTAEDWRRILRFSAKGCRCIEDAGKIVATTTLLPYETRLAWIGMVLTRPEYRRQGLARRLMEDAISKAELDGIHTLKLDATDEGRPLYESLGFVVENAVERWGRNEKFTEAERKRDVEGHANVSHSSDGQISGNLFAQDALAFGASRRQLLEVLFREGRCNTTPHGYVLSRPGTTARYLGPCVANSDAEANSLIGTHLKSYSDTGGSGSCSWFWDLFPSNSEALRCARKFGFTRRRTLWRMRRGEIIKNYDAMVYAIAGFELG
jgi:GNAT superfamily N-acetyltransferase